MKREHVHVVAGPRDGLPVGGKYDTGEIVDGSRGSMLAGNPLRIHEGQFARLNGNRKLRMQYFAGRISDIERNGDGSIGLTGCGKR